MANNDAIIGVIMSLVGVVGILAEFWFLIVDPIANGNPFQNLWIGDTPTDKSGLYWAMALPLFVGTAGVLAIILWIGITMVQTPAPEAWDFDDLEDDLDDMGDSDDSATKDDAKPAKKAKKKAATTESSDDASDSDSGATKKKKKKKKTTKKKSKKKST